MLPEVDHLLKFFSSGDLAERAQASFEDRACSTAMFLESDWANTRRGHLNRPGIAGGSNSCEDRAYDNQDDEQVFP